VPANPFKPTAGSRPPALVGRDEQIAEILLAIDDGPGAPGRLTIFTGARGVGKTVMLTEVAESVMRERGWLAIHDAATLGLMARIDEQVQYLLEQKEPQTRRRITGFTLPAGLGGIQTQVTPKLTVGLRQNISELMDRIEPTGGGLLITVDEVHAGIPDLRELATLIQLLVREDRQIALIMAGLPSAVSDLLNETVLTFLRRADRHVLADVNIDDVQDSFIETIFTAGRSITPEAAELAAAATFGYPFLIQLVGYHIWRAAASDTITIDEVNRGVATARRRLGALVHETALADLSDQDKSFLVAIAADDGPARIADLRLRLGNVSPQYINRYRQRLLAAGMITQKTRGEVDLALPYLREFLREHSARYGLEIS